MLFHISILQFNTPYRHIISQVSLALPLKFNIIDNGWRRCAFKIDSGGWSQLIQR